MFLTSYGWRNGWVSAETKDRFKNEMFSLYRKSIVTQSSGRSVN